MQILLHYRLLLSSVVHCMRQVLERPEVWVMDTPGIMPPALRDHDHAMKLALIGERPTVFRCSRLHSG
jgi:hypothetical protein